MTEEHRSGLFQIVGFMYLATFDLKNDQDYIFGLYTVFQRKHVVKFHNR